MRAKFMAGLIIDGTQNYVDVIASRPDLKAGIDAELIRRGRGDLIVEPTPPVEPEE